MEGGENSRGSTEMYRECQRNHAASLGSYATDGCGEFTLHHDASSAASFNCAACGCHRNFHRKITFSHRRSHSGIMDFRGAAAAAATGGTGLDKERQLVHSPESSNAKKRFRTKFTEEQKGKMLGFAAGLGWKMRRKDEEDEIERFCIGIGITRKVFKVWMHNHKNSSPSPSSASTANASSLTHNHL